MSVMGGVLPVRIVRAGRGVCVPGQMPRVLVGGRRVRIRSVVVVRVGSRVHTPPQYFRPCQAGRCATGPTRFGATGEDTRMHDDPAARKHRGELFAGLAAVAFGSAYVATSFALHAFEPLPAAVWRSVVAALVVGLLYAARQRTSDRSSAAAGAAMPSTGARVLRLLVLALLSGPLFLASMNFAVAHVGATITAFVAGLYAVLSAVIAPALLPERLAPRVVVGFILALAGTALLAELDPSRSDGVGMAWGISAAVTFALFLVLSRRWSAAYQLDGLAISVWSMTTSALVLGAVVLLTDAGTLVPASVSLDSALAIGWLAAAAVFGQVMTIASVRLIPAARSAAFLLLNPITATVLAALLLGERPSPLQIVGGVLVLLGIAAATMPGVARLRLGLRVS